MADLIDRQTIIDTIHSAMYPYFCGAEDGDALSEDEKLVLSVNKAVCTAIKALPSADAVKVVRCEDCKFYHPTYCEIWSRFGTMQTREKGYCYMGERTIDDLINRQAAIDTIDEVTWYHQNKNGEMVAGAGTEHEAWYKADDIYKALKAVPSVDAVEVVRCKDCAKCQVDTIFNQYWCGGERVLPDGFCNFGRRKDG